MPVDQSKNAILLEIGFVEHDDLGVGLIGRKAVELLVHIGVEVVCGSVVLGFRDVLKGEVEGGWIHRPLHDEEVTGDEEGWTDAFHLGTETSEPEGRKWIPDGVRSRTMDPWA